MRSQRSRDLLTTDAIEVPDVASVSDDFAEFAGGVPAGSDRY